MTDVTPAAPSFRAPPFSAWERAIAGRYLRAKRKEGGVALISMISFIGITLAVAVLIIVMSVMNGFRTELLSRILGFNGHLYVGGQLLVNPDRDRAIAQMRQLPGVLQVAPMIDAQALVVGGNGNVSGAIVRGMKPDDLKRLKIVSTNIKRGSLEGFGDGEYGGDMVLVGERLAASMGVDAGDPITLISPTGDATAFGASPRRKVYTVGGVFSIGMSEYDQAYIYMPLEQAQIFFGRDSSVDVVELMTQNPDRVDDLKPDIERLAGPGSVVTDWRQKNMSFFNALQVERNVMRLILMLIVAIAAMNIISGLVMLVKNKGRDIAILRTMGASRSSIMRIFFMSGAAVGVFGTLAGLLIGILFCTYIEEIQAFVQWVTGADVFNADVYFLAHIPAKIDWAEVALITFWSMMASFVATLWPAFRASRLDPVEALRYE